MEPASFKPASMLRYVLTFFAVKLAAAGALLLYVFTFDDEPPVPAIAITILAVSASVYWFSKSENRPMLGAEIMWFAVGNAVAELVLTIALALGMIELLGAPISWEGLSLVLGDDINPQLAKMAMLVGLIIGSLQILFFSAFFGWLMTKNLPQQSGSDS